MDIFDIKSMLISERINPFNSIDWLYELKFDGIRCIAYLDKNDSDLRNKKNFSLVNKFPELNGINNMVKEKCILDGELIVLKDGIPDFFEVQRRAILTDQFKIKIAYNNLPATFVAYDILYCNNQLLTFLPLIERKNILFQVIEEDNRIAISRFIEYNGIELYNTIDNEKLEGVVAKKKDSKYFFDKRSKDWVKFKRTATAYHIICGYIKNGPKGNTLILGQYNEVQITYSGSVTFGVKINEILNQSHIIEYSPFNYSEFNNNSIIWVEPNLVCLIEYMPNTKDVLRQPVFKRLCKNIDPNDCKI